jgi:uncharacterized protein YegL
MTDQNKTLELNHAQESQATEPLISTQSRVDAADIVAAPYEPDSSKLEAIPEMKVMSNDRLRNAVASDCKQLVMSLPDISSSMSGRKAKECQAALEKLFQTLADPENKDGFIGQIIPFNSSAHVAAGPELVTAMTVPKLRVGGGTNFDAALDLACKELDKFANRSNPDGWDYLKPVVLFKSDGQSYVSVDKIDALKERAQIIAIAYGADADANTLKQIASDGQVHVIGSNGDQLTQFLASVGKTLSQKLQAQG